MRLFWIVAALTTAAFSYLTYTARGVRPEIVTERFSERRATFQDWLAACRPGGVCVLTTLSDPDGAAADYILRVETDGKGPARVMFVARGRLVSATSPIRAEVDGARVAVFAPYAPGGWLQRPDDPRNLYRLAETDTAARLLEAMRAGGRLTFVYAYRAGSPPAPALDGAAAEGPSETAADAPPSVSVPFSLIGLRAAEAWAAANRVR